MRLLILAGGIFLLCVILGGLIVSVLIVIRLHSRDTKADSGTIPIPPSEGKSDWTVTTIRPRGPHQGIR